MPLTVMWLGGISTGVAMRGPCANQYVVWLGSLRFLGFYPPLIGGDDAFQHPKNRAVQFHRFRCGNIAHMRHAYEFNSYHATYSDITFVPNFP